MAILLVVFYEPIIIHHQNTSNPFMCNNSATLRQIKGDDLYWCYINCADKFGCHVAWSNRTYYDNKTDICYCDGFMEIDFNPDYAGTLIGNVNVSIDEYLLVHSGKNGTVNKTINKR